MRTELINPNNFKPVEIKITFETQGELDEFGSLMNCCAITDSVICPHYSVFSEAGANIHKTNEVLRKIADHPSMVFMFENNIKDKLKQSF